MEKWPEINVSIARQILVRQKFGSQLKEPIFYILYIVGTDFTNYFYDPICLAEISVRFLL